MYCARLGIALGAVKFMLRGERVFGASTPATLGVGRDIVRGGTSRDNGTTARALRESACAPTLNATVSLAAILQLLDGEELTAVPDGSSDRLQQARELGPLYSAVFGKQAGAPAVDSNMVVV
jgi:hypothetical protein